MQEIMNLLLSSAGLDSQEIKKEFQTRIKSLKSKKLCLICYEMKQGFEKWIEEKIEEFNKIDSAIEVVVLNLSENIEVDKIPKCDIYYVSGGNTYYILGRMRELGLDSFLINEILKNKIYFGVSAGSMILGQDINRFSDLWNDKNQIGIKNFQGFEMIPFDIVPHYSDKQEDAVMKHYQKLEEPVVALTDKQAVLVTDEEMEIIGPEEEGLLLD